MTSFSPQASDKPPQLDIPHIPNTPLHEADTQHVTSNDNHFQHHDEELVNQKTSENLHGHRSRLGLHPRAPVDEDDDRAEHQDLWWSRVKLVLREPFAEFFGTFILVLFGDGSVAQVLLSNSSVTGQTTAPGANGFGAYQSISWGLVARRSRSTWWNWR